MSSTPRNPKVPPGLAVPAETGIAVRQARVSAGFSQRELAWRAGVSNSVIAEVERGADVRWSTLETLIQVLPALATYDLLPNPDGHPPPALASAWRANRALVGWSCERVSVTLRRTRARPRLIIEMGQLRHDHGRRLGASGLSCLMRTIFLGDAAQQQRLDGARLLKSGTLSVRVGSQRHAYRLVDARAASFTYRFEDSQAQSLEIEGEDEPEECVTHSIDFPVRELRLITDDPPRSPLVPRATAWLPHGMSHAGESRLLRFLHLDAVPTLVTQGGRKHAELRVEWPPVGVAYAMFLRPPVRGERPPARRRSERSPGFAGVAARLAAMRAERGCSLRDASLEVGLSWAALRAVESGAGGRVSTLARYLDAWPDLAPQDLLPLIEHEHPLRAEDLSRYYERLFGFRAAEVRKIFEIRRDLMTRTTVHTEGLLATGRRGEPVRLRTQTRFVLPNPSPYRTPTVSGGQGQLLRRSLRQSGSWVHQDTVPRGIAERGTRLTKRFDWAPLGGALIISEALAANPWFSPPVFRGTSLTCVHPAEILTLEVRLPARFRHAGIGFAAWPHPMPPAPSDAAALDVLDRFEHESVLDGPGGISRLTVRPPTPGMRYGFWWQLPN